MNEKIYVLHENQEWTVHLFKRLDELGLPYEDWFIDEGLVDLSDTPPPGVFYSRMSASSHTRGHRYAPEMADAILVWLEHHGRTVFNGSRALSLEVSKVKQDLALNAAGIRTPRAVAANGKGRILEAARKLEGTSFITKHNRAGKGLGVRLFHSVEALQEHLDSAEFEPSIDGITLIQEYIRAPEPHITRCEFVGGEFVYAVRVDTSEGFELCPADACVIEDLFCPAGEQGSEQGGEQTTAPPKFQVIEGFDDPVLHKYREFLNNNGIAVAGIESIRDAQGTRYTYDVNTNTNYNADAEAAAGTFGMLRLARYLGSALESIKQPVR